MKRSRLMALPLLFVAALFSCSDRIQVGEGNVTLKSVCATAKDFIYDEIETRTDYTVDASKGFLFSWAEGDTLGIYPVGGNQVDFPISSGEGSKSAKFNGGAWALRHTYTYGCYYPFSSANFHIKETQLPVSYVGQKQTGNDNTDNLGAYDYMSAAAAVPDEDGELSITMQHMGCFAMFLLAMPEADSYTEMTLESDDAGFVTEGTYDLSADIPAITPKTTSKTWKMGLDGISTTAAGQSITLYAMFAPDNMKGSNVTIKVIGESGKTYKATVSGKNMKVGMAYRYTATLATGTVDGEDAGWDDEDDEVQYEYVDLGLSVKWATFNVGATKPEEYGDYFAWGETEPYYEPGYAQEDPQSHWKSGKSDGYTWVNTPYQTANTDHPDSTRWTKYLGSTTSSYKDPSATNADALKTVLDPEDDAAHVNWGGGWRIPTQEERDELCNTSNCTWTWYESGNTEFGGIAGYKVTSKKSGYAGNWIFLPAVGYRYDKYLNGVGFYGGYWFSSLNTSNPLVACYLGFDSGNYYMYDYYRYFGRSVRPVCQTDEFVPVSGVSLNYPISLSLFVGDDATLTATVSPYNATFKAVSWTSSRPDVATVDASGNVTAVGAGTATITATSSDDSHYASCIVTVSSAYEYVDLGLSVKWATCNVGASKPEEYGDYFAWGATEPLYQPGYAQSSSPVWKSGKTGGYNWVNTPYQTANTTSYSSIRWTKYLGNTTSSYKDPSATDADALKTVLDPEDDAAHVNWGGAWRMPTSEEQEELINNCTWTWTTINGINGCKVQSKKSGYTDRWIFLPAAGYRYDTDLGGVGCYYWSSSLYTSSPYSAGNLYFNSSTVGSSYYGRDFGQSVRPVRP